jgi:hypothetical protein
MIGPQEFQDQTRIEAFQNLPSEDFVKNFSSKTPLPKDFSDKVGHFTTNEYDYPDSLEEIKVRGGIHLAVMGGLDPVLGQVAVTNPDLTIIMDINRHSMESSIEGRIKPILETDNGTDYWNKVGDYFVKVVRKIDPTRWDFPVGQDATRGGWSSPEYFAKVKQALLKGKIKWVSGDISTDGIGIALQIAKQTGTPIRLIYVSNIFDYSINNRQSFIERLSKGIEEGIIDKNAQIIDTGLGEKGIETKVFDVSSYLQIKPRF